MRLQAKAPTHMPVDHPAPVPLPTRRMYARTLNLALGFLGTLALLMALNAVFDFGKL